MDGMNVNTTTRATAAPPRGEPASLIDLLRRLARESTSLVQSEVRLVRAELSEKVARAESGIMSLTAGALVLLAGMIILLMALAFILNLVIASVWLSFVIVGGVTSLIGAAMLGKGRSDLKARNLAPRRTEQAFHDDVRVAQEHLRSAERGKETTA